MKTSQLVGIINVTIILLLSTTTKGFLQLSKPTKHGASPFQKDNTIVHWIGSRAQTQTQTQAQAQAQAQAQSLQFHLKGSDDNNWILKNLLVMKKRKSRNQQQQRSSTDNKEQLDEASFRIPLDVAVAVASADLPTTQNAMQGRMDMICGLIGKSLQSTRNTWRSRRMRYYHSTTTKISKWDVCLFTTNFCDIAAITLSVFTLPLLAADHFSTSPQATAAFVAFLSSLAPLFKGIGKNVNSVLCQRLGGKRSAWIYLFGLACLSFGLSITSSIPLVAVFMIGYELLASIQWASICSVLDYHYKTTPTLKTQGLTTLGISTVMGALFAQVVGVSILKASNWRVVCRFGGLLGLVGAFVMYAGVADETKMDKELVEDIVVSNQTATPSDSARSKRKLGTTRTPRTRRATTRRTTATKLPLPTIATKDNDIAIYVTKTISSWKRILTSRAVFKICLANGLSYVARNSGQLLGPFMADITSIPDTIYAAFSSSVTVGFLYGLAKAKRFGQLETVQDKFTMLKDNYRLSFVSIVGLAVCGLNSTLQLCPDYTEIVAAAITILCGMMASTVAVQFYQLPNILSDAMVLTSPSISVSLTHALGLFAMAQLYTMNCTVLGKVGWSASWIFLATIFGFNGRIIMNAMQ